MPSVADVVAELATLADEATDRSVAEQLAVRTAFGNAIDQVFALGGTPRRRAAQPPGWVLVERAVSRARAIAAGDVGAAPASGSLRGAVADVRTAVAVAVATAPARRALVVLGKHTDEASLRGTAAALEARGITAATVVAATESFHDAGHLLDAEVQTDHHTDQSWFVSDRRAREATAVLRAHGIDAATTAVPTRLLRGAVEDQIGAGGAAVVVNVGSSARIPFTRARRVARLARRSGVELLAA